MAAAVANAMAYEPLAKLPESLRELGRPELEAFSAGLAAGEGDPIADNAVRALEAAGVPAVPGQDYHRHTAHTLCGEEAERYDLLVAMSRQHALGLLLRFPQLAGRITTLGEDVPDPVRRERAGLQGLPGADYPAGAGAALSGTEPAGGRA